MAGILTEQVDIVRWGDVSTMIGAAIPRSSRDTTTHGWSNTGSGPRGDGVVRAQHTDPGAKLGPAKGDHVLADMSGNNLTMLRVGMSEDVLDEIVAVLVARDVDQGNTRTVDPSFADPIEVAAEKFRPSNLEALLDDL